MLSDDVYAVGDVGYFCKWRIENFSYSMDNRILESPRFSVGMFNDTRWGLYMFKNEGSDVLENNLVCFLKRYNDRGLKFTDLFYEISVIARDGSFKRKYVSPRPQRFYKNTSGCKITILVSENYRKNLAGLLNNDTFVVCCRMWKNGLKDSMHCLIRTPIKVQKRCLRWVIEKFSSIEQKEYQMKYSSDDPSPFKMNLSWYCKGYYFDERIQINIAQAEPHRRQRVVCKISVLDNKGNVADSKKDEYNFLGYPGDYWPFPPFIMRKWLFENKDLYLPNDTLSLQFEMKMSDDSINKIDQIDFGEASTNTNSTWSTENNTGDSHPITSTNFLMSGLLDLYKGGKFCDVTLQTQCYSFPAHKAVLCAQSSVFAAMFENDLKEKQTGRVRISNLSDDTVQQMLMFMYTDKIEELHWENAVNLYFASDEYDIVQLKSICQAFLKAYLDVSNVTEALVLADLHQDADLKRASHDFILEHDSEIINSDNWNRFMESHLKLSAETMRLIYRRKLNK